MSEKSIRIGLFGAGNMGGTLLRAFAAKGSHVIRVYDIDPGAPARFGDLLPSGNVSFVHSPEECAEGAELLIFAVKPFQLDGLLGALAAGGSVDAGSCVFLSVCAGVPSSKYTEYFHGNPVVRTMPNLPALAGAGYTGICFVNMDDGAFDPVRAAVTEVFGSIGEYAVFSDEKKIDRLIPVTSSSPAYVCMMIEAMADGAVRLGFPRKQAYEMSIQAVLGTAEYLKATGTHPAVLKDMVCSPAGTTIEAVASLEEHGFRAAVLEAMKDCYSKVEKA